jgi:hypothetical protein
MDAQIERLIKLYEQQASFAYWLSLGIYLLAMAAVTIAFVSGFFLALLANTIFLQIVSTTLILFGAVLLVLIFLRHPIETLKQARTDLARTFVLVSSLKVEQEEIKRQFGKLDKIEVEKRQERIKLLFEQLQASNDRAVKNLGAVPDILSDLLK